MQVIGTAMIIFLSGEMMYGTRIPETHLGKTITSIAADMKFHVIPPDFTKFKPVGEVLRVDELPVCRQSIDWPKSALVSPKPMSSKKAKK
jgi:hypothetical protein